MFVAMNRFLVLQGKEEAFEAVWRNRDSRLKELEGFQSFHLLKGASDDAAGVTLYASHSVWRDKASFTAWTKSQQFRDSHKGAGGNADLYAGPPSFEGFESVLAN